MDTQKKLESICRELLETVGYNPDREGLKDTPRRWAKWWLEFSDYNDNNITTTFQTRTVDQLVVVSGIRVWSLCEHHLLPFWCDIAIGYLPDKRILGLSKFARIAQLYAHGLQVQEQLVCDIAQEIKRVTKSKDVAVVAKGEHLCMTMRGIKSPAIMTSSEMHGRFRDTSELRAEMLQLME